MSWMLFYFLISEVIVRFMVGSTILSIIIMLIITFAFYIIAITVISKKFNQIHIDITAALYFILVMGLTFFKSSYSYAAFNFNPLSIINDFRHYFNHALLISISNIIIYLPLGIYTKSKIKLSNRKFLFIYLIYIFFVESIQSITHSGVFDVNDIITNTIGFYLGVLCCDPVINYFTK